MNQQKVKLQFATAALLSAAVAVLTYFISPKSAGLIILSVPFDYAGRGLRHLSLGSQAGNMLAIGLYGILCSLPLLYALYRKRKNTGSPADWLLVLISGYTFYLLYQFINPALLADRMPGGAALASSALALPVIKTVACCVFYSLVVAWMILNQTCRLHAIAPRQEQSREYILLMLEKILLTGGILYLIFLFYFQFLAQLQEHVISQAALTDQLFLPSPDSDVTAFSPGLSFDTIFLWLDYLLSAVPIIALVALLYSAICLLEALRLHPCGMEPSRAARLLYERSRMAVIATVLCNLAWNLLQYLCAPQLQNVNIQLEISFLPLILSFCAMLLSHGLQSMYELHEENEMII